MHLFAVVLLLLKIIAKQKVQKKKVMQNLDMKDWHQLMSVNLNWIVYTPQEAELQWQEHKFTEF